MILKKFFPLNFPRESMAANRIAKNTVHSVTKTMMAMEFCIAWRNILVCKKRFKIIQTDKFFSVRDSAHAVQRHPEHVDGRNKYEKSDQYSRRCDTEKDKASLGPFSDSYYVSFLFKNGEL